MTTVGAPRHAAVTTVAAPPADAAVTTVAAPPAAAAVNTVAAPSADAAVTTVAAPSADAAVTTVAAPSADAAVTTVAAPSAAAAVTTVAAPSADAAVTTVAAPSADAAVTTVAAPSAAAAVTTVAAPSADAAVTTVAAPSADAAVTTVAAPSAAAAVTTVAAPSAAAAVTTVAALARDITANTGLSAPVTVTVANAAAAPAAALNRPTNPGLLMYADGEPPASVVANWSRPGALVVVGRSNYDEPWVHTMADGGATVMIYLDPIIDNDTGRYHDKLINASEFGPAVPKWPGKPAASEWGSLNDFRVGSVLQDKLPGVIDLIVSENPQISGIFLDDVGSRSWFPGINWDSWSNADKEAYRNGAIAITQTARAVADEHDLFLMVNGTWGATGLAGQGTADTRTVRCPGILWWMAVSLKTMTRTPKWLTGLRMPAPTRSGVKALHGDCRTCGSAMWAVPPIETPGSPPVWRRSPHRLRMTAGRCRSARSPISIFRIERRRSCSRGVTE